MIRRWRWVPGYKGYYQVSHDGKVRSVERLVPHGPTSLLFRRIRGRILIPAITGSGYLFVGLTKKGKAKAHMVHTLVLVSFHGPRPIKHVARHLNGNCLDNREDNLKWGTAKQNSRDIKRHGTLNPPHGSRCHRATFTEDEVLIIRARHTAGETTGQIAKSLGRDKQTIRKIVRRKTWKHI